MPNTLTPNLDFEAACQALAGIILERAPNNLVGALMDIRPLLGITHISYLRFQINRSEEASLLTALSTYSQEWQIRYFTRRYHEVDPLFSACLTATSPFDWRSVRDATQQSAAFFADAAAHGVGINGVSIPVRQRAPGIGMVSFNSDLPDDEWDAFRQRHMAKLEVVACLVDGAAGVNAKLAAKAVDLSKREHQTLIWAARGKTSHEIAEIMDISYASVRSYQDAARRKLACRNVTHAVATALATALIHPLAIRGRDPSAYSGKVEPQEKASRRRATSRPAVPRASEG